MTNLLPHGALVLYVKKNNFLCLCVDFWELNYIIQKNKYLLSLISNFFNSPRKAYVYTKFNLYHTYYLVQIVEENRWKIALCTHYGFFKWIVMSFSLTNVSEAFQQFTNNIFPDLLNVCVVFYLDYILIYTDNMSQYKDHIKKVLQ